MGASAEIDELIGTTVEQKYRLERRIGSGGMGTVYEALHTVIDKRVALKFLDPGAARDADAVLRFQREAKAASAVDSAHIVQIFDNGEAPDGRPYLVMELLKGEDLRARLRRAGGRLSIAEAVQIARQVLRGLARAHRARIVHRDLKPDNVFLCERDGEPPFVKIVDFAISKIQRLAEPDVITSRGTVLGTASYMSPEQAQSVSDIDGRADIYGVGAILFECLTGRTPHKGPTYESVLINICTEDAPDIRTLAPEVPDSLARVIARALRRDRELRFATAEDFAEALVAAASPESLGRPRHLTWVVAVVAALATFVLTAFALRGSAPGHSPASTPEPTLSLAATLPAPPLPVTAALEGPPAPLPASASAEIDGRTGPAPQTPPPAKRPAPASGRKSEGAPPALNEPPKTGVARSLKLNLNEP